MTGPFLIDVALGLPGLGTFQYSVPERLQPGAQIGKRVAVNVRNRRMIGYLVAFSAARFVDEVRDIETVVDDAPILSPELLELTRWMSEYYQCSWGQAIEAAMPAPFKRGRFLMKSRAKKTTDSAEVVDPDEHPLTASQDAAYRAIAEGVRSRKPHTFLIHGVTGSGKTEVYMHAIRDALAQGRGAIVLVPEISLTPQTVDRFHSRFGDSVAVIHSRLAQARRVEEWHRIRKGEARVVVGARSAVFAPVKDLGVIAIDEEHDGSYKQDETPRYVSRDVAKKRAELEGACLLLGSATPSLESYYAAEEGKIVRLELPERIEKRPLPAVEIVDMRRQGDGRESVFSKALEEATRETLAKKEQVMLLLNRRGFYTHLHCSACGYVMTCPNCRIGLAYHFDKAAACCHICDFRSAPDKICPQCSKSRIHYFGIGTQKVEVEAVKFFPGARIARMDTDSTSKKDSHETILRAFKRREIDILVGTQMIAKGHDFPNVSLIGVISADTALHVADFRSAERTFDLLTQVAGRAGRGDVPGRVLIQTHVPQHYSIQAAKSHDYRAFYDKETQFRRELSMPPYTRLVRLIIAGAVEGEVARQAYQLTRWLEHRLGEGFKVVGPAPCLIAKEGGNFRWNLYIKGPSIEAINPPLKAALSEFKRQKATLTVDVDPQ